MSEVKLTGQVSKVDKSVDRFKTCPFLLRVFCNKVRHHAARDYEQGNTPENELQIYTWMDATLGELAQLIKDVNPDARRRGTQFAFAIVAPDGSHNHYYIKEIGKTENGQRRMDDQIQLAQKRFHIGDYLDVAISYKRPEPMGGANGRHERTSKYQGDDNQRARYIKERHSDGKPSRTSPKDDHRHHPY